MSETMHDLVRTALLKKEVKNGTFCDSFKGDNIITPEKYQRMWQKITGETISLDEARKAIKQAAL